MRQLIYTSLATVAFAPDDLRELLERSRANNERLGVTGMLVYADGNFLQVLEGQDDVLSGLLEKIEADPRHRDILTIWRGNVDEPSFGDWRMGFFDGSGGKLKLLPGFIDLFGARFDTATLTQDEGRARDLILRFKEGAWRRAVA